MFFLRIAEAILSNHEKSLVKDSRFATTSQDGDVLRQIQQKRLSQLKRRFSDTEDEYVSSPDEQHLSTIAPSTRSNSISPDLTESELSKALDAEPTPPQSRFQELYAAQQKPAQVIEKPKDPDTNSLLYNLLISRDENNNKSSQGDGLKSFMEMSKLITDNKKKEMIITAPSNIIEEPLKPTLAKPRVRRIKSNVRNSLPTTKKPQSAPMFSRAMQLPPRPIVPNQNSVLASLIGSSNTEASPISSDSGLGEIQRDMPILDLLGLKLLQHQRHQIPIQSQNLSQPIQRVNQNNILNVRTAPPRPQVDQGLPGQLLALHASHIQKPILSDRSSCLVKLAKKNLQPIQAQVSDWIKQAAIFVASTRESVTDSHPDDWLPILQATWHRLLATYMAENALDAVVVDAKEDEQIHQGIGHLESLLEAPTSSRPLMGGPSIALLVMGPDVASSNIRPTRRFAETLFACLKDISHSSLSKDEYNLIRHAIILTYKEPESLPLIGSNLVKAVWLIRNHRNNVETSDLLIEERLSCLKNGLLYLTNLSAEQIATLFCQHLQSSFLSSDNLILASPTPDQNYQINESDIKSSHFEQDHLAKPLQVQSPICLHNGSSLLSSVLTANDQKDAWRKAQMNSKLITAVNNQHSQSTTVIPSAQNKQISLLDDLLKSQ